CDPAAIRVAPAASGGEELRDVQFGRWRRGGWRRRRLLSQPQNRRESHKRSRKQRKPCAVAHGGANSGSGAWKKVGRARRAPPLSNFLLQAVHHEQALIARHALERLAEQLRVPVAD